MSTKLNVDSIINESIKLEKLNEDVINTINNIAETKASDAVTPVANDVDTLIGDHVIGKGAAENSAVLKGGNNTVTGKYSAAIGYNTIAKNVGEHASGIYNVSNSDTQFSIGIGTSDSNRKNAFEVKQNGDIYAYNYKLATGCINVTHEELVNLRKNNRLIPGQQYRITDYITTTTQSNTQSAGHPFDVIVIADDVDVLNENARAIQREGDTYFVNSDLNAWELKYCLDNDASKFAWADATNGKGVIYYMKDEFNNECPYDFKNIKFYYEGLGTDVYTFTWIDDSYNVMDTSVFGNNGTLTLYGTISGVYNNVIKPYMEKIQDEDSGEYLGTKQTLNNITFISDYMYEEMRNDGFYGCYNNSFGNGCYSNSFGNDCSNNSFGNDCYYNSFGNNCDYNSFGNYCRYNSFGNYCYYNSFGNNCNYNSFGNYCQNNSFGNNCQNNSFGNNCQNNSFGNNCNYNSFGYDCKYNSFGNYCQNNSFGNYCYYNSFGNNCNYNSFGYDCKYNSFGNYCQNNSFGNYCQNNSFGNYCQNNSFRLSASKTGTLLNHCHYNTFNDGCCYNVIWNSVQPTSSNKLQNINIVRGVIGKSSAYNLINIVEKNANHEIKVAKNTNGDIKVYCEADLTKLLSSLDSDGCLTLYHE